MSDKTLSTLAVVAAVMVILAFVVGSSQATVSFEFNKGQLLVTGLDPSQIDQIMVEKGKDPEAEPTDEADDGPVELRRVGKEFVVASMRSYPAANREVNTLIMAVLGIRCGGQEAVDQDSFADLGLDGASKDSQTVTFLDREGKELVKVHVGKNVEGGNGPYIRRGGSDDVYRAEDFVSLKTRGLDYVEKKLLEIKRDDMQKVTVAAAGGPVYVIESPAAGEIELQNVPEGKKVKGTEDEAVFGACTYLNFSDFKSESEGKDLTFDQVYTVATRFGAEYRLDVAKHETPKDEGDDATNEVKWWVRCRASYSGPKNLEVEGKSDEELADNVKFADAAKAVQEFEARHQSWIYEISSWKAENMVKKLDDLLEEDDGKPTEVDVSHILIAYQGADKAGADVTRTKEEAQAEAERLLAEVQADPSKFADLAKEHSNGPSGPEGGVLPTVSKGSGMVPPFEEAALSLMNVGDIAPVVETDFGYHVIIRTK